MGNKIALKYSLFQMFTWIKVTEKKDNKLIMSQIHFKGCFQELKKAKLKFYFILLIFFTSNS